MRRYFLLLSLIVTGCCAAAESKLHGSWKSDLKLTSDYLLKYANLDEHQKKALGILFGKSVITFKPDGTGSIKKESFVIPTKDGARLPMSGGDSTFSYELLGESEGQVVIKLKTEDPSVKKHPFLIMKFHGENVYSIEISENLFDLNGREFFQRTEITAKP